MKADINPKKIKEILTRGVEEVIERKNLEKRLYSGEKLRIKHGIDPTGPKIHIGRAVQLWKLKDFQELGHRIVLIIGDFTARIGDASDKQAMRKILSEKEVRANMKNYIKQIGRILDINKVEMRYNSEWLDNLAVKELINLETRFTVQQLVQRRNFKERWDNGKPIGLHELNYPLLQGFDSLAVRADVELGGFDQLFNLKTGREVQKIFGQQSQDIITLKMLFGLDGRKMSTSWGNVINIMDDPNDQFGKIMSIKDDLIADYFELCTRAPLEDIKKIKISLEQKKINPRDLKIELAREIVSIYHGKKESIAAEKEFNRVFKEKKPPEVMPEIKIKESVLNILDLLERTELAPSRAEAKRLVLQKGVKIDGDVQDNWQKEVGIVKDMIIQVGKRKFIRII